MRDGSSPRVRGTQRRLVQIGQPHRFIPACAGNTTKPLFRRAGTAVHPRVCGEHTATDEPGTFLGGSSPRVRGTPRRGRWRGGRHWFIPACAGNTCWRHRAGLDPPVHPRVCGEHCRQRCWWCRRRGSSPRVRGTPLALFNQINEGRFIPACAGNTYCCVCIIVTQPVHPRVCGEHAWHLAVRLSMPGSSPRVRGTLTTSFAYGFRIRFIPACAGNTTHG